jgi:1-deoxy-D-xylulose-5-phosphate synthase
LTGRRDVFGSIRQHQGISGFTRVSESPYDAFTTGHSSTSISAALGITAAKQLKDERSKVIAVIGDGSMTAGLAYEGLNQALRSLEIFDTKSDPLRAIARYVIERRR